MLITIMEKKQCYNRLNLCYIHPILRFLIKKIPPPPPKKKKKKKVKSSILITGIMMCQELNEAWKMFSNFEHQNAMWCEKKYASLSKGV